MRKLNYIKIRKNIIHGGVRVFFNTTYDSYFVKNINISTYDIYFIYKIKT